MTLEVRHVAIHAFLQSKTTQLVDSLEMAGVKMMNSIGRGSERPAAEAVAA